METACLLAYSTVSVRMKQACLPACLLRRFVRTYLLPGTQDYPDSMCYTAGYSIPITRNRVPAAQASKLTRAHRIQPRLQCSAVQMLALPCFFFLSLSLAMQSVWLREKSKCKVQSASARSHMKLRLRRSERHGKVFEHISYIQSLHRCPPQWITYGIRKMSLLV